jgi:hydrogenase maturation protein HypF
VKEPRRAALGLLHSLPELHPELMLHRQPKVAGAFSAAELATLCSMLERGVNSPLWSSAGRLFDAVASLVGLRQQVRFEGQAAMELEFALEGVETDEAYAIKLLDRESNQTEINATPVLLDWSPMIKR